MRPEKLLQYIECSGNSFSLRYFCIIIPFIHSWSSSLLLEVLRRSVKVLKYLLNQHSSYLSSITFSDCNLPPFSLCDPSFQGLSDCFHLLGHIHVIKQDLRPSIQIWDLVPTVCHYLDISKGLIIFFFPPFTFFRFFFTLCFL